MLTGSARSMRLLLYALFNHPQSIKLNSRIVLSISSQVTYHWGEPCNRTGDVHPVDSFHSLDNLGISLLPSLCVGIQKFTISGTEM